MFQREAVDVSDTAVRCDTAFTFASGMPLSPTTPHSDSPLLETSRRALHFVVPRMDHCRMAARRVLQPVFRIPFATYARIAVAASRLYHCQAVYAPYLTAAPRTPLLPLPATPCRRLPTHYRSTIVPRRTAELPYSDARCRAFSLPLHLVVYERIPNIPAGQTTYSVLDVLQHHWRRCHLFTYRSLAFT